MLGNPVPFTMFSLHHCFHFLLWIVSGNKVDYLFAVFQCWCCLTKVVILYFTALPMF